MKQKEKISPHALIAVYVNKDRKIEETICLQQFIGGDYGRSIMSACDDYDDYIFEAAGFLNGKQRNTLYHAYVSFNHSQDYWGEWDMTLEIHRVVKVMSNYDAFRESEEKYEEQCELEQLDSNAVKVLERSRGYDGGSYYKPEITHNDLKNIVRIIAKDNIRLAHRISMSYNHASSYDSYHAEDLLGDFYDREIGELENKRLAFHYFLRYKSDSGVKREYHTDGFTIISNNTYPFYFKQDFKISYSDIDQISDEILNGCSLDEIVQYFYDSKVILDALDEEEDHDNLFSET